MKKALSIVLIFTLLTTVLYAVPLSADAASSGGYGYEVMEDGTAEITAYTGAGGRITIPSVLGGNTVASIGNKAFEKCSGITEIIIPNTVKTIGRYAFSKCTGMTSVTIPDSLTTIGDYAFNECQALTGAVLPDSVTYLGDCAFDKCGKMVSITLPDSLTTIRRATFYYCTGLKSVRIPDSVTTIGSGAFEYCSSLTDVVIGKGVTLIGDSAFSGCNALTDVHIPSNVKTIEENAFTSRSLRSVMIDYGVESIGYSIFSSNKLGGVFFPPTVKDVGSTLNSTHYLSLYVYRGSYIHNVYPHTGLYPLTFVDDLSQNTYQSNGAFLKTYCTGSFQCTKQSAEGDLALKYASDLPQGRKITAIYKADFNIYAHEPVFNLSELSLPCDDSDAEIYVADVDDHLTKMDGAFYSNGRISTSIFKDGYYIITGKAPVSPTEGQDDSCLGDIDGDGEVSVIDATYLLRELCDIDTPPGLSISRGDVNGDGLYTIMDVSFIQRWLSNLMCPYPIGK